ncbi:MAG: hypothetical protein ACE145_20775 [Terriglobia bacterium]
MDIEQPKPVRKERPSSLDFLILGAIQETQKARARGEEGNSTLYSLKDDFNLSVGASRPALARLKKKDLVAQKPRQGKLKHSYVITLKGEEFLSLQWKNLLRILPSDTETIVRTLTVARMVDWESYSRPCIKYLERAVAKWRLAAQQAEFQAHDPKPQRIASFSFHERLRTELAAARLRAEAEKLQDIWMGLRHEIEGVGKNDSERYQAEGPAKEGQPQ